MANPGVAARIHPADQGDTQTLAATLEQAEAMLDLVSLVLMPDTPAEMIADTGYHSRNGLKTLEDIAWKSRISEKEQKTLNLIVGLALTLITAVAVLGLFLLLIDLT
jgi:hypothetical protein